MSILKASPLFVGIFFLMPLVTYGYNNVIVQKHNSENRRLMSQDMFKTANKTYVIDSDYEITENIVIPSNCVLIFKKGCIKGNNIIRGNNTRIIASKRRLFSSEIIMSGSWRSDISYPEWFGAKGDGITDDTEAIQKVLMFHNVRLSSGTYLVNGIVIGDYPDINIRGDKTIIKTKNTSLNTRFNVLGNLDMSSRNTGYNNGRFYMSGVTIDGNANNYNWTNNPNPNYYHGLALNNYKSVTLENCCFKNTLMCGVRLYLCDSVTVRKCTFQDIGTETGKGNDLRPFGPYGWQWEGVSLTGWRNINGGSEKVYRRSSQFTVEDCKFNTILNSPVGGANISKVVIKNNTAENLRGGFTEFHVDNTLDKRGMLVNTIDTIIISANYINKNAAGFINFSGPFSSKVSTAITIKNNTIDNLYGIKTIHNRASHGSGTRALVVVYPEKVKDKSNIEVMYDSNTVNCSRIGFLKEKLNLIYCTKVKKMTFRNSEFNVYGYDKETVFYTESGNEEISNCSFNFGVSFSQFAIHEDGDFKMINNKIITPKSSRMPQAVAIFRKVPGSYIKNVEFNNNRINGAGTLMYLNAMTPQHVKILNNTIDFEVATLSGVTEKMETLTISGNKAKRISLSARNANSFVSNNNIVH